MSSYHYNKFFIHVLVVLCADDDGSNNIAQNIDPKALEAMINEVNTHYEDAGFHFTFNRYIDIVKESNTLLNQDFTVPSTANLNSPNPPMTDNEIQNSKDKHNKERNKYSKEREGHLVVFFRYGTELKKDNSVWTIIPAGYAFSGNDSEFVAMGTGAEAILFAHEAGHYFHLVHTHSGDTELTREERDKFPDPKNNSSDLSGRRALITEKVRNAIRQYVNAGNPPEHGHYGLDVDWLIVRDTPPDPSHEFFIYHGHQDDNHGVTVDVNLGSETRSYTLFPDKRNLMSYFFRENSGPKHFSGQQLDRMRRAVKEEVPPLGSLSRHHLISQPIPFSSYWTLATAKWSPGWTNLAPYSFLSMHPYLIAYSQGSKEFHFDRLNDDGRGITILNKGHWALWTTVDTFSLGQDRFLLVYHIFSGDVRFDKIRKDGSGSDNVWSGKWAPGWTHVVPIGVNSYLRDHLMVYNALTGDVRIDRFNNDGVGTTNLWQGKWATGWNNIMPYRLLGTEWRFLIYDKTTGLAHFDRLDDPTHGSSTIFKQNWTSGWTHFMPYPIAHFDSFSSAKFLAYNEATGEVHFDRISDDGFEIVRQGKWEPSWSTFVPTFITNEDHGNQGFIAYNRTSGKVNFNRFL